MKKMIALVMSLVMLLTAAACAEQAKVLAVSKPYLDITADGNHRQVDLSSLSLRLSGGKPEGVPTLQAELQKNGRVAERVVAQYIDGRLFIEADGLSRTYVLDPSKLGPTGQTMMDAVFDDIDSLLDFKLPMFGGVSISRMDMTVIAPLTGAMVTTDENGKKSANIDMPYILVKQLLTMVNQYKSAIPESAQSTVAPLFGLVEQMLASDSGFALKGRVVTQKKSALSLDIYPVQNGVTAEAPAAKVKVVSARNRLNVTVDVYQGDSTVNAATFSLTSDPGAEALSLSLDVMSMVLVNGSLYKQDGAQAVDLDVSAMGWRGSTNLYYGVADGVDFVNAALNIPGMLGLTADVRAVEDGNGGSAGTLALGVATYGDQPADVAVSGEIAEGYDSVSFGRIKRTRDVVDILHMTDAERSKLASEVEKLVKRFLSRSRIG